MIWTAHKFGEQIIVEDGKRKYYLCVRSYYSPLRSVDDRLEDEREYGEALAEKLNEIEEIVPRKKRNRAYYG